MRILLAGGGTAGHINPGLAIADYACKKDADTKILFVGTEKGLESTLVPKAGYEIKYIKVSGLSKKLTVENMKALCNMLIAKRKCKKIIREFKPDIVVGTGCYVCAPAVMAANSMGIPTLIHEQNVFPGKAVKRLSKKSDITAISFEDSRKYFADAKRVLFTGNPIRPEIISCNRDYARNLFGLNDEKFVLVFGGSLGAEAINKVCIDYIKTLDKDSGVKLLFAPGERNYEKVMNELSNTDVSKNKNICIVPYIHNMDQAMNAADVVVCRSGAITVSELCALGKPAILVPSPNVTNNHQEYNARALSDNGAAITILEKDFCLETMKNAVDSILFDSKTAEDMKSKSISISSINALEIIHSEMKNLIK